MSYAIFNVMYGIPLYTKDQKRTEELTEFVEKYPNGLKTFYNGSANLEPAAFGIKLDGFDECCNFIDLSDLKIKPTEAQLKEYDSVWSELSDEDKQMLKEQCGEPRVFFLASTS